MYRFNKSKDGIPLIPYTPDPSDRHPVPEFPSELVASRRYLVCSGYQTKETNFTDPRDAYSSQELVQLVSTLAPIMDKWREEAMATGKYENAYLVVDDSLCVFWDVYERKATIPEIIRLKQQARDEIKYRDKRVEQIDKEVEIAKNFLGEED